MEGIIEHADLILGIAMILLAGGIAVWKLTTSTKEEREDLVEEWLLEACLKAERELRGEVGQEKLQWVYTRFEKKFPAVAMAISFATFAKWVDSALEELKEALESEEIAEDTTTSEGEGLV